MAESLREMDDDFKDSDAFDHPCDHYHLISIFCAGLPIFKIHQRPDQEVDGDDEKGRGGRFQCESES